MPLDAICINALTRELAQSLLGAKIDKVQQPARDMLILSVHGGGGSGKLLISSGTGSARVHFTNSSFENPQSPPMFCMLLRKHLVGSRIDGINQPDFERMIIFDLNAFDEMGVPVKKQLVVEMMGRNSNIILTGPEGHIIDALRRVDSDMSRARQILPGLIYRLPPKQEKPVFALTDEDELREIINTFSSEKAADKWLMDTFSGLSPLICRELCFRASGDASKPGALFSLSERKAFAENLLSLRRAIDAGEYTPTMLTEGDTPRDFSFMPILQYESAVTLREYPDFSNMLEDFFTQRDKQEQIKRKSQALLKSVKSAHERSLRKLSLRREELAKAENRELYRKQGDLVTANLYRMLKGDHSLVCENYYEEDLPQIEIPLDPLKTPQQNAARFYREYNKAKTAAAYLAGLIEKGEREEAYLASVLDAISHVESEADLSEIRRELTETGFIKAQRNPKGKKEKVKATEPMRFTSSAGMEILVGKNNAQNDQLITKIARRSDIWLHVQKLHGSHVIISCNDMPPDDITLTEAASLAAFFSQGSQSGKTAVDYTQARYVKKPSGALPGAVIYTDYKTVMANPDGELASRLREK